MRLTTTRCVAEEGGVSVAALPYCRQGAIVEGRWRAVPRRVSQQHGRDRARDRRDRRRGTDPGGQPDRRLFRELPPASRLTGAVGSARDLSATSCAPAAARNNVAAGAGGSADPVSLCIAATTTTWRGPRGDGVLVIDSIPAEAFRSNRTRRGDGELTGGQAHSCGCTCRGDAPVIGIKINRRTGILCYPFWFEVG